MADLAKLHRIPSSLAVAVCSSNALSQNVPISITASGKTVTINSAPSISAGACTYSYVSYSALSMQAGGTYDVDVVIDPQHTVSSNSNNEAIYNIVVPGVAAPTVSANAHAKYDGEYQLSVL